MHIGVFTDSFLPNQDGVATTVATTAQELINLGHQVTVIAPGHPHTKDSKYIYRLYSIKVMESPEIYVGVEVTPKALIKMIDSKFDLIHGHSGGPVSLLGWQVAQYHKVPFIETYHTMWRSYSHYFPFPQMLGPFLLKKISAFLGNDCTALIAPTEKVKYELKKYGVKKPIYIIPNGINLSAFMDLEIGYLHQKLNLPKNSRIVLSVGRLEKEKSVDFLIKSFAKINLPNTVLVLVGDGRDQKKLQDLVKELNIEDKVFFIESIPFSKMPNVYADADLFIFASKTESQGMAITEALAAGVPVIAVNDSAYKGVVVNHFNGFLVENEVNKFSQKIKLVLEDSELRKKLSDSAKKSAWKFSIFKTAKKLERVYQEILKFKATGHSGQ